MASGGFISKTTFKRLSIQKKEEERDVKNWTELPTDGTLYKIIGIDKKLGKFGDCFILTIRDKNGEETKVWSPKGLQREFAEESTKLQPRTIYFCSLGQFKKQDGSGHRRNEYESCYR